MKPLDISTAAFLAPLVFSEKAGIGCRLGEAFGSVLVVLKLHHDWP